MHGCVRTLLQDPALRCPSDEDALAPLVEDAEEEDDRRVQVRAHARTDSPLAPTLQSCLAVRQE